MEEVEPNLVLSALQSQLHHEVEQVSGCEHALVPHRRPDSIVSKAPDFATIMFGLSNVRK